MLSPFGTLASCLYAWSLFAIARVHFGCNVPTTTERLTAMAAKQELRPNSLVVTIDINNVAFALASSHKTLAVSTTAQNSTALWQRPCMPRARTTPVAMVTSSLETLQDALPAWTFTWNHRVFVVGSADPGATLRALKRVTQRSKGAASIVVVNGCCGLKPSVVNFLLRKTHNAFDCACVQ